MTMQFSIGDRVWVSFHEGHGTVVEIGEVPVGMQPGHHAPGYFIDLEGGAGHFPCESSQVEPPRSD